VTTLEKGENIHFDPEFLPDGRFFLFDVGRDPVNWADASEIVLFDWESRKRRDLLTGASPKYAPTGHLLYVQRGPLMAVPFDLQRREVQGTAVSVLDGVLQIPATGVGQYGLSDPGSLAYVSGGLKSQERRLAWVDRKGTEQTLPAPPHAYRTPRLSPDGRRIAVAGVDADVWLYDVARDALTRLTFHDGMTPEWSPDGRYVAFLSNQDPTNVDWQRTDGSGDAQALANFSGAQYLGPWSPDGRVFSLVTAGPNAKWSISTFSIRDHALQPFVRNEFNNTAPQFSPDSRFMAYASDESGRNEIYVRPCPGPGSKWQVSTEGGTEPVWAHNGEIFYRGAGKMMVVETVTHPSFSAGTPKALFDDYFVPTLATGANYDVSPDGRHTLMVKAGDQDTGETQITVVQNWFEELKQKVPAGKK
jgi:dipeptidyl aminopeptidase/acylaminoacyl peptidase